MLQISQTENPICSATIDQIRLRRATTLPLEFRTSHLPDSNPKSRSGLVCSLDVSFQLSSGPCSRHGGALWGGPSPAVSQILMIGFRRTATMASRKAFQASCQAGVRQNDRCFNKIAEWPATAPQAERIQNLRFAQLLCAAQNLSTRSRRDQLRTRFSGQPRQESQ